MKIGMIFPGQGSQYLGMGKQFYDSERIVQEYFEEATSCLERNFVRLCFASSDKDLIDTSNAQTAIFLISSSIFHLLKKKYGIVPDVVAGHSLGEYAAIHAAGGITFPDGLYLLTKRARFMDEATRMQDGGMLAVVGLTRDKLERICKQYDIPDSHDRVAQIVNFNSPTQMVISGTRKELEAIQSSVPIFGGKAIMLKVAGAFHSRLMNQAECNFIKYLIKVDVSDLNIDLVNNLEGRVIRSADDVKVSLKTQSSAPVLWWESMKHYKDCDLIIEVGPGSTFSRMLKREWPDKEIVAVNNHGDVQNLMKVHEKLFNK